MCPLVKCVEFLVASLFDITEAELQTFLAPKQDGQSNLPLKLDAQQTTLHTTFQFFRWGSREI